MQDQEPSQEEEEFWDIARLMVVSDFKNSNWKTPAFLRLFYASKSTFCSKSAFHTFYFLKFALGCSLLSFSVL